MKVTTREANDVKIADFEGNLDTNTAPDAEEQLKALAKQGATKILVNFEKLDYVSSAGLRVLLATAKGLQASDGSLRICGLNETVEEIFDISGFSTIFNVFGTEAEALEGFWLVDQHGSTITHNTIYVNHENANVILLSSITWRDKNIDRVRHDP